MKKVRAIHFWIGVIVSIFLFIESVTGIIMYFEKGEERSKFSMQGQFPSGQMDGSQQSNLQNGNQNTPPQSGQTGDTNQMPSQNFEKKKEQSAFSVKSLHTGIIGLISGIGIFILTGTGLILSWIMWSNKRKGKKRKQKVAMAG